MNEIMNENYELFGIDKKATLKDLKKAKKETMLTLHPDKHFGEEKKYTELFKKIDPAYERIKIRLEEKKGKKVPEKKKNPFSIPTTKDEWFAQKVLNPNKLKMSDSGDLVTSMEPGATVIPLEPEVASSVEYIHKQLSKRNEQCKEAEKAYTTAKRNLIIAMNTYKNGESTEYNLIEANKEVHNSECKLNSIMKEPRYVDEVYGLHGYELWIDMKYDKTKIPEPVVTGIYTNLPWKYFWMEKPLERIPVVQEEETEESPQEGGKREKTQEEKDRARKWAIINARRAKHG